MARKTAPKPASNGHVEKPKRQASHYIDTKGARRLRVASNHPLARCSPRDDRVIVQRDELENSSRGGIIIARTSGSQRKQTGTVIAIGPGKRGPDGSRIPLDDVELGDRVILTGYAGLELNDSPDKENEEFVMLREDDVTATLDIV